MVIRSAQSLAPALKIRRNPPHKLFGSSAREFFVGVGLFWLCTIASSYHLHLPEQPTQAQDEMPRRLTISVSVSEPSDAKVKDGDRLQVGDLIANRGRERRWLEKQKARLHLSLTQIQSANITPPLTPKAVPDIIDLPLALD